MIKKANKKIKIKIEYDAKGKFIRFQGKKIRIKRNDIGERELIKWIIKHLKPKRKPRTSTADPKMKTTAKPTFTTSTSSYSYPNPINISLNDQLNRAKQELDQKKEEIKKLMPAEEKKLLEPPKSRTIKKRIQRTDEEGKIIFDQEFDVPEEFGEVTDKLIQEINLQYLKKIDELTQLKQAIIQMKTEQKELEHEYYNLLKEKKEIERQLLEEKKMNEEQQNKAEQDLEDVNKRIESLVEELTLLSENNVMVQDQYDSKKEEVEKMKKELNTAKRDLEGTKAANKDLLETTIKSAMDNFIEAYMNEHYKTEQTRELAVKAKVKDYTKIRLVPLRKLLVQMGKIDIEEIKNLAKAQVADKIQVYQSNFGPFVYRSKYEQAGNGIKFDTKNGLTNTQIDEIMKPYRKRGYLGCIPSDYVTKFIPNIKPNHIYSFVMNLDKHTQDGSHWVSCFIDPVNSKSIEYYDSYGEPASDKFMRDIAQIAQKLDADSYLKFKENKIVKQGNSTNCGFFAVSFLFDRYRGKPFSECTGYDDHIKGERDIEAFKKKIGVEPFKYLQSSLSGTGIVDVIKDGVDRVKGFLFGSKEMPTPFKRVVQKYQNVRITGISVCREPLQGMIDKIANIMSLGKWEENKKRLHYDNVFHLYMILFLEGGKRLRVDKNQRAKIDEIGIAGKNAVQMGVSVPSSKNITVGSLFANGEKLVGPYKYWHYDPIDANCQLFIKWSLQGSEIMEPSYDKFIMQDSDSLLEGMGFFKKFARGITEVAGRFDQLIGGKQKGGMIKMPDMNPNKRFKILPIDRETQMKLM